MSRSSAQLRSYRDIISWLFQENGRRMRESHRTHFLYLFNRPVIQYNNVFRIQICFKISRRATVLCDVCRPAIDCWGLVMQSITCSSNDYTRNLAAQFVAFNNTIVPRTQGFIAGIRQCDLNASDKRPRTRAWLVATFGRKSGVHDCLPLIRAM